MQATKHSQKKTLFDDEEIEEGEVVVAPQKGKKLEKKRADSHQEDGGFKINAEFAKKFEHNKRRELLDKAKEKYGEKALLAEISKLDRDGSDGDSSSFEEEDDEGELINAKVEKKFLETIAMIRTNDPKLKEAEGELFKDEDFDEG